MSNYPGALDTDSELGAANNNIVEIGSDLLNEQRDAIFNIESTLGINPHGTAGSVAARLSIALDPAGNVKASAIASLGLVTLPIYDSQIASTAAIQESKLKLNFTTQSLHDLFEILQNQVNVLNNFYSIIGIKLEPHIEGTDYRHKLSHIDVDSILTRRDGTARDSTNAFTLIKDISDNLSEHEDYDGETGTGTIPDAYFAHVAAGIELNTSVFSVIPQTENSVQKFAEFVDNSNLFTIGNRLINLFTNGIPRTSRLSVLDADGYGQNIVPATPVIAFLNSGGANTPVDNIDTGDDVVQFNPDSSITSNNIFDGYFSQVKDGDVLTINYGNIEISYIIDSVKYTFTPSKRYYVRINGKNLEASTTATARIDRTTFSENKYGVLALAAANSDFDNNGTNDIQYTGNPVYSSLIAVNPRSAVALGIGFDESQLNNSHYNLYLAFYPNGNPKDKSIILPAIDVTNNLGVTPGSYTLDNVIENINNAFRKPGFNYRFVAFQYNGQIGIALAEPFLNASFSIISGVVSDSGLYDSSASSTSYPNNVIDVFNNLDTLGFGPNQANLASPPFALTFGSPEAAQLPTKVIVPLKNNFYYVNGTERDRLRLENQTLTDTFGDGYWPALINLVNPGTSHVEVTYRVNLDLSKANLKIGKTLAILPELAFTAATYSNVDYGRFIISNIVFGNCDTTNAYTDITVYDGIFGTGSSPFLSSTGINVRLYFGEESIGFDSQNVSDTSSGTNYKRYHEIYVDQNGHTFSHERARFAFNSTSQDKLNIIKVSPKLRGYKLGTNLVKIDLVITSYAATTGLFSGFLCKFDGITRTNAGPFTSGKKGDVIRFYDETNIDYIDIKFDLLDTVSNMSSVDIQIQLFSSLANDGDFLLLGNCQLNDVSKKVNFLVDDRQFGNTSEKNLSNSALDYIAAAPRNLHENGVIRGFDYTGTTNSNEINLTGGTALINGKFVNINNGLIKVPKIKETYSSTTFNNVSWAICANSNNELVILPLLDYDSSLPTPNDTTRIFTAVDPIGGGTFNLAGVIFSDLVNKRKDLAILHIIDSNVTGTGTGVSISVTITDSRKFVNDADSQLPLTLTSDVSSGNFKTFEAIKNWTKYNSKFNYIIKLRGDITINSGLAFDFKNPVKIIGDGANLTIQAALSIASNVYIENVNFITNFNGAVTVANATNVKFKECIFATGALVINCLTLSSSSNIEIDNCIFNYSAAGSISAGDLVNTGTGLIHASVPASTIIKNIKITNNIFNYLPASPNNTRFSFINFEYASNTAAISDLNISNNKFYNNGAASSAGAIKDYRAVISIINTFTGSGGNENPILSNCYINENFVDDHQLCIITSTTSNSPAVMEKYFINAKNININNNNFFAIGFYTNDYSHKEGGSPASPVFVNNKSSGIKIIGNTCALIYSADQTGAYYSNFNASPSNGSVLTLGWTYIADNFISNIHIGGGSTVFIKNNILTPREVAYLANYTDSITNAIDVRTASSSGNPESYTTFSYVDGNVISSQDLDGTTNNYTGNVINILNINHVVNNVIRSGIDAAGVGINVGGAANNVARNEIYRNSTVITGYVTFSHPAGVSATNSGMVVDNIFDDFRIDNNPGSDTNEILDNSTIPTNWTYERNKNQIKEIMFHLAEGDSLISTDNANPTVIGPIFSTTPGVTIGSTFSVTLGFSGNPAPLDNIVFTDSGVTVARNYSKFFNLSNLLPLNVRVLEAKMGLFMPSGNIDTSSGHVNSMSLHFVKYPINNTTLDIATYSHPETNPAGDAQHFPQNLALGNNITTQFLTADISPSNPTFNQYVTGQKYLVGMGFVLRTVLISTTTLKISPIRVKFRW